MKHAIVFFAISISMIFGQSQIKVASLFAFGEKYRITRPNLVPEIQLSDAVNLFRSGSAEIFDLRSQNEYQTESISGVKTLLELQTQEFKLNDFRTIIFLGDIQTLLEDPICLKRLEDSGRPFYKLKLTISEWKSLVSPTTQSRKTKANQ